MTTTSCKKRKFRSEQSLIKNLKIGDIVIYDDSAYKEVIVDFDGEVYTSISLDNFDKLDFLVGDFNIITKLKK